MFSFLKKLFGKPEAKVAAPIASTAHRDLIAAVPNIEVAHLSLAAIVNRFPQALAPMVLGEPDATATVALPLSTILKQLPSGVVKMSLASLHRQAPSVVAAVAAGDKRTVEVPLSEIFRHVRPHVLKRREQRPAEVPANGYNLFGNAENPYELAPSEPREVAPNPIEPPLEWPHVLKMDSGLREHFGRVAAPPAAGPEAAPAETAPVPEPAGMRVIAPPDFLTSKPTVAPVASAPPPVSAGRTVVLRLAALAASWPDEIRTEIEALDPETSVAVPEAEVTGQLAKGRVIFTWGQIVSWLEPQPAAATAVPVETTLQLPLKVVAPAFLAATKKPKSERKLVEPDAGIPMLFNDGRTPPPGEEILPPAADQAPEPVPEPLAPAAPVLKKPPQTVGDVFGEPNRHEWTPAEIVQNTVKLTGVAGAIVALQEGLQVATSLPDGVKSDVVAAFLPQIFARLNQYAGEMKLGDVDDLLFTTRGAHCQIYRLGYVYFAVLGKPGEALPWHELRLIADELARQTKK